MKSPLVRHAIEAYATHLRVERNLAPRTRTAYAYDLGRFEAWLREKCADEDVTVGAVAREHLAEYLVHLRRDLGCEAAAVNRAASSLRGFMAFCASQNHIAENPAKDLAGPKKAQKLPIYLTDAEVRALLAAPDRSTCAGRRDHAILMTLAGTGMRLQELVGLDTLDLDFARRTIRVFGKGRKERLVPMGDGVAAALRAMLEDAERVPAPGERAVFLNLKGSRLTGRAVEYVVGNMVAAAGIGKDRISPHKLRHTFATLLHGRAVELIDIQALLGHASLASTQIYTHTDAGKLRGAINRLKIRT